MGLPGSIILASGSPRRADLLRAAGIDFEVVTADIQEHEPLHLGEWTPEQIVRENARRKGEAVSALHSARLVLAADTSVFLGQHVLNKPADMDDAVRMLTQLSGRTHEVWTGVWIGRGDKGYSEDFAICTRVTFRELSPAKIARYFERVNPLDKAGAYGFQEHGAMIVAGFDGPESNIIGLPVESVLEKLSSLHPEFFLKHPAP
ncbi:Maf family protein [Oscillatoria laete-virens NRMC-F 0139]|nr:Maf family protein [Oscillatoria laete-virens]MDL5055074.1 Maf family protein [Oscillatoria laete-virens NRMC-F 0139]